MSSIEKGKFLEPEIKEGEERGHNVIVIASFYRHAEKDPEGLMTDLGFKKAEELGRAKKIPEHGIKFRTSPFERAQKTTEGILKGIEEQDPKNKIFKTEVKLELAPPEWKNWGQIAPQIEKIKSEKGQAGVVEYVFQEPLMQEDLEHWTSSLAYFIERYNILSQKARSNFKIELAHITHDVVMGDFLRKMLVAKDENGQRIDLSDFNKFKEFLGGDIKYLEGFEFMITSDEAGKQECKILFRGEEYKVDKGNLHKLAEAFRKNPYKGRVERQNL